MKKHLILACLFALAAPLHVMAMPLCPGACFSLSTTETTVSTNGSNPYAPVVFDLGEFSAGTYLITGSGTVDLVPDSSFTINPDGTPTSVGTTGGYGYFNPGVSFSADSSFGPAGTNAKIGELIDTLSAPPTNADDWFLIGYSKQLTLFSSQHIFAAVNDTYYVNDHGALEVSVSAVPEPKSYVLMLAGLGLMSLVARRKLSNV